MSKLSAEMLRLWDADPDANYEADSPFTTWWDNAILHSIHSSRDDAYRGCLRELLEGSRLAILATQYDIRLSPSGLAYMMRSLELFQVIDPGVVPQSSDALDVEDIDQAMLLFAYQYDTVIGTPEFCAVMDEWYTTNMASLDALVSRFKGGVENTTDFAEDGYDPLDKLDELVWTCGMLEWLKLDDPRRDLGVDISEYQNGIADFEQRLRTALGDLRKSGAAWKDAAASKRFWWRH